ncbi:MAG: peptide chain release factor-like protein [Lentisphaerae bacterium]|nr:peptide chain release factor-like protein [Lentisphaerota bacterium]
MTDAFVSSAKAAALAARMAGLGIREADLVEKFVLGSGRGGQKINKTSSCVYLRHVPSGIEVKCQRSRSRELNRFLARREIAERFAERVRGEKTRRRQEAEKIRRQKRRRSRRQKALMLADKKHRAAKKDARRPVAPNGE